MLVVAIWHASLADVLRAGLINPDASVAVLARAGAGRVGLIFVVPIVLNGWKVGHLRFNSCLSTHLM